jgi:hypothetical protein
MYVISKTGEAENALKKMEAFSRRSEELDANLNTIKAQNYELEKATVEIERQAEDIKEGLIGGEDTSISAVTLSLQQ